MAREAKKAAAGRGRRGDGDTEVTRAAKPPVMMRSRGQLATVYAPGSLFTFEGGKGACMSVSVANAPAPIGRTTETLIYEQVEESIRAWHDRAVERHENMRHDIDASQAIDKSLIVGGQISLGIDRFTFTDATKMGYVPFPLSFVCRKCGLHRECRNVNTAEEDAQRFQDACPSRRGGGAGEGRCANDWEQIDVVMAHWSGSVRPVSPLRHRWDDTRGVTPRDWCGNCGGDTFLLRRPSASFADWYFECTSCRQGRSIVAQDLDTLERWGREIATGGALRMEVNMEPVSYRASQAYYPQSDKLLVFRDDRWLELLKRHRSGDLADFLGQYYDFPPDALSEVDRERLLREDGKSHEWEDYQATLEALRSIEDEAQRAAREASGRPEPPLARVLRANLSKYEGDWASGTFAGRDRAAGLLPARIEERGEWIRRFDPIRMAVEHRTLEDETLDPRKGKVDGKPQSVDLRFGDEHLRPQNMKPEATKEMLAQVNRRLRLLGIEDMRLIRGLELCEYSYGFSRTSPTPRVAREKSGVKLEMPVRLNLFDRVGNPARHPILCAVQKNEAFYVKLNERLVARWLATNGMGIDLGDPAVRLGGRLIEGYEPFQRFLDDFKKPENLPRAPYPYVYTLLHTVAHQLIGIVSELSGLDIGSFGEHLFVPDLSFLVYRRGVTMDLGNLSSMWRNHSDRTFGNLVLHRMASRETLRCGSETVCTMRGGACPDCILIPENACLTRNELLSRSVLIGDGTPKWDQVTRHVVGFYDVAMDAADDPSAWPRAPEAAPMAAE